MSYLTYGGNDYIGIVQNIDDIVATIYDYGMLKTQEEKLKFIELGEIWWNESNQKVPINLFLRSEWHVFRPILRTFNAKDTVVRFGPHVSLKEIAAGRSKKRSIQLVRRCR
jgi:hypothetical protein